MLNFVEFDLIGFKENITRENSFLQAVQGHFIHMFELYGITGPFKVVVTFSMSSSSLLYCSL